MKTVLVTGGAGYIGAHTCKRLLNAGYIPITYDNLSTGHKEFVKWGGLVVGDLHNTEKLTKILEQHDPVAVIHFAASASVGESVENPFKYYRNNVGGTLSLIEAMVNAKVRYLVFSSTCAIYGIPEKQSIDESMLQQPINPYGRSKLMIEQILRDLSSRDQIRYVALRYFNAAGADRDAEIGEWHESETHLIPLAIQSARGGAKLKVFGTDFLTPDGTAVRDYIHVEDLADGHVRALEYLISGGVSEAVNLGTGQGSSVREVIQSLQEIGVDVAFESAARRTGDPAYLVADNSKATHLLNWRAQNANIKEILKSALAWHKRHENKTTISANLSFLREFIKYFAASAIALLVDYATYWAFAHNDLMELNAAASVGYTAGLIVAYFLISEKVFSDGWLKERRTYEMLLFALSGVLGIALTYGSVVLYVTALGKSIHGAKLFAVAVSFVSVYLFRKLFVFRSTNR